MEAASGKVGERLAGGPADQIVDLIYAENLKTEFPAAFQPILQINRAHTIGLLDAGVIDVAVAAAILKGLRDMEAAGVSGIAVDPTLEESYFNHEAWLIRHIGIEAAGRMHTARSRNDLGAAVDRLRARGVMMSVIERHAAFRATLIERAGLFADVVMPGYTHMQPAQPITFGYHLSAIANAAARDHRRLFAALEGNDRSPLGAAALSGTRFPVNLAQTADLLGFSAPFGNGLDAVAARDFLTEAAAAASLAASTCGRMAQDFYFMVTDEFSSLEIADQVSGTSSIMPQKKNPFLLEVVRGLSSQITAAAYASQSALAGKNYTVAIDTIREDLRGAWEALDKFGRCATLADLTVRSVTPKAEVMLERARNNFATVTDLADLMVNEAGLPFREAHHVVGHIVRLCIETGRRAGAIDAAMVAQAASEVLGRPIALDPRKIAESLDPVSVVASRTADGGASPASVRRGLERLDAELAADRAGLEDIRARLAASAARLDARVRDVIAAA